MAASVAALAGLLSAPCAKAQGGQFHHEGAPGRELVTPIFRELRTDYPFIPRTSHPKFAPEHKLEPIEGWVPPSDPGEVQIDSNADIEAQAGNAFRSFETLNQNGWVPPDTNIGVGPSHVVVVTNADWGIYDINGNQLYRVNFNTYFGNTDFYFDPTIFYDPWNGKWVIHISHRKDATRQSWNTVLVSSSSNAMGGWYYYDFNARLNGGTDNNIWPDYPHIGYDTEAVYISANMFQFGGGSVYPKLRILNKSQIYNAQGAGYWDFWNLQSDGSADYFLKPAQKNTIISGSHEGLVANTKFFGSNKVTLRRVRNPLNWSTGPTLVTELIGVGGYAPPPAALQPAGSPAIGTMNNNIMSANYAFGRLELVFTRAYNWGDGKGNRAILHTVRLNADAVPATVQRDRGFGAAGFDYFFPVGMVNFDGDTIYFFNRSGVTQAPEMRTTSWRVAGADFEGSGGIKVGASYGGSRWGDYSGIALDPFDFKTVWGGAEFAINSGFWGTWAAGVNYLPLTSVSVGNVSGQITGTTTLNAVLSPNIGGQTLYFYVNNGFVGSAVTNVGGLAQLTYTIPLSLGTGNKTIRVEYLRNSTYNGSVGTGTLSVSTANTALAVANASGAAGNTVALSATLRRTTDSVLLSGESVSFYVDGAFVASGTTNGSGVASVGFNIPDSLAIGAHTILARYNGSANYSTTSNTGTLTISTASTTLTVPAVTGAIGDTVNLSARLTRNTDGGALVGLAVAFQVDGVDAGSAVTDGTGTATIAFPIDDSLGTGAHMVTATFAGTAVYVASTGTGTLNVNAADSAITVDNITGAQGDAVNLTATLFRVSSGAGLAGQSVDFLIDGVYVGSAVTDATGLATLPYTITDAVGDHVIEVDFAGDALNNPSSGFGTLSVL